MKPSVFRTFLLFRTHILTAGIFLCCGIGAMAQTVHTHPQGAAMGKTGTAYLSGSKSPGINPANLMLLDHSGSLYVDLLDISVGTGGDLMNFSVYNQYLTQGRVINREIQNQMLDAWFPRGRTGKVYAGLQVDAMTMGLALRLPNHDHAFSLSHTMRGLVRMGLNRPVLEAGFGGLDNELFGTPSRLSIQAETLLFHDITAGYALTIAENRDGLLFGLPGRLDAGIAPKLLIGTHSMKFRSDSFLTVSGDSLVTHDFNYRVNASGNLANELIAYEQARAENGNNPNPSLSDYLDDPLGDALSPAGTGFGLSLGLNLMLELPDEFLDHPFLGDGRRILRAGLSLTDVGRVPFSKDAATIRHDNILDWQGLRLDNDWIDNEFEGNLDDYIDFVLQDSLGSQVYLGYGSQRNTYHMPLPTQLILGTYLEAGRASAALDFNKGLNNAGLNSRKLMVGAGVEYKIGGWLPVRAGMSVGGKFGTRLSSGIGIYTSRFRFNTAFSGVTSSRNNGAWLGVSFNTTVRL